MISQLSVKNFKSIQDLDMELGRVTVLIGANGSGKSNILEAIALCSAAAGKKLDHEFLASRGIRVPDDPRFMRSAFEAQHTQEDIDIKATETQDDELDAHGKEREQKFFRCVLQNKNNLPYSTWTTEIADTFVNIENTVKSLRKNFDDENEFEAHQLASLIKTREAIDTLLSEINKVKQVRYGPAELEDFLIYSPENTSLRTFETEGQIQPLGIKGEGLFKLLTVLFNQQDKGSIKEIKKRLTLLDWFDDFEVVSAASTGERTLKIKDRYLDESLSYFTQKSANEGFLFLLFYFTLFTSRETPSFFAIDNIDASLNPKLCSQLLKELVDLAKPHDKQAIVTTHNPAVLDGLDLNDDAQRLYVVSRNKLGHTKVKRVTKQASLPDQKPLRLSEAFLRGYLGGLPGNF